MCVALNKLAIVGNSGGTNIGESLRRAGVAAGHSMLFFDANEAGKGPRLLRSLRWHLMDHRPLRLESVSENVIHACSQARPDIIITTGAAPVTESALCALRGFGICCINYSTDDPWNRTRLARWYLRALPKYDIVFTARRANIGEFKQIGCNNVRYLPFGYDESLFFPAKAQMDTPVHDVLFVGGADRDRITFMTEFVRWGPPVALVGGYWERSPAMRRYSLGMKAPEELRALTVAAKVNLCLVRRANRDGHVMRSFEIAAIGGCMLAEDTSEHREIFGRDGEAVLYFRTAREAAVQARALIANPTERARLSASVRARILAGRHTYRDRLASMLEAAVELSNRKANSEGN